MKKKNTGALETSREQGRGQWGKIRSITSFFPFIPPELELGFFVMGA